MTVAFHRPRIGSILGNARDIYISASAAEIEQAPALLREARPADATVTGIYSPLVNHGTYADPEIGLRVRCFLLTRQLKRQLASGLVDYCPWRYGMINRWMTAPRRFDTALVMVSPPNRDGKCSLGVQADFFPSFHRQVERVVGFINPAMPFTQGDTLIDYDSFAATVDYDVPLVSLEPRPADEASITIADHMTQLVPDGATVQFGVGQIPSQVLARLQNQRGLRVHSGIVDDNVLALDASGALDPDQPIVTGTAIGTRGFYEALADNPRFAFRSVAYTHSHQVISQAPRFTAINSGLQADLLGQVTAEYSGGRLVATPGGLPDFVRGALASEGGQSIVAVRARTAAGHSSGIVPLLDAPGAVTIPAVDADVLVTEFGVAQLRGRSLDQRAEAVIAIAAPEEQEELSRQWARIRSGVVGRAG